MRALADILNDTGLTEIEIAEEGQPHTRRPGRRRRCHAVWRGRAAGAAAAPLPAGAARRPTRRGTPAP